MLGEAIVIAGDGAGADVSLRAHAGIANIGEVVNLGAFVNLRILDLDEIADMRVLGKRGTGPEPGERPNAGAGSNARLLDVTKGSDGGAVFDGDAGADHDIGLDGHVAADARVVAEEHRVRRHQRGAVVHGGYAQAPLHQTFGGREFGARIHAKDFLRVRQHDTRLEIIAARERHRIGEVILCLGVVVADPRKQPGKCRGGAERHDAGIAQCERALGGTCILFLADARKPSMRVEQQAAIAGRVLCLKSDHDEIGTSIELAKHGFQRLGAQQRRIAVKHDHRPLRGLEGRRRRLHRIRRAELVRLDEHFGLRIEREAGLALDPKAEVFVQPDQLGTADAVKAAAPAFETAKGPVIVLYGDTPLLRAETLKAVLGELNAGADLVVIGFEAQDPTGYGRLLFDDKGRLSGIREEKDASAAERALTLCNSGIMAFRSAATLSGLLARIGNDNAKAEYYLTDAVALARGDDLQSRVVLSNAEEVLGVNSRAELATAEGLMQRRLRIAAMDNGATLVSPDTVFFSYDTGIGRDVTIEPNVVIGPDVTIEDGATIRAFCYIEQASIGPGASIGPFTRLRPGAALAKNAHVGNFVEIKNSQVHEGAKVNHLTYIGDASVGAKANIGAGTITCNYDGFAKHRTEIGAGAFIGSNSSLVAPVKITND